MTHSIDQSFKEIAYLKERCENLIKSNKQAISRLQKENELLSYKLAHINAILDEPNSESKLTEAEVLGKEIYLCTKYQGLTLNGAIQKLLQEHLGKICHTRFIANELIGRALSDTEYEMIKRQLNSRLANGLNLGFWKRGNAQPESYFIEDNFRPVLPKKFILKEPGLVINKNRRKHEYPVNPNYEGLTIMQSVEYFLQEKRGLSFKAGDIVNEILSNECIGRTRQQATDSIYKALNRGYLDGRFIRPQYGIYGYPLATSLSYLADSAR
ncbi:hypothetical protein I8748_32065 [Nostoc sp. CENA67]|uniref:Uncharacterized protein n=1 Tax=Amazonocrinis nigriterrae CENA67 TaxID=2794033 RepID=A0A8J7I001_9NOST|nr:hypothetical protein [Amazonocrinis nigriterrae]MBH8566735.1 hypothetical protein [Amazonocrinis nigriterrae CENA67]